MLYAICFSGNCYATFSFLDQNYQWNYESINAKKKKILLYLYKQNNGLTKLSAQVISNSGRSLNLLNAVWSSVVLETFHTTWYFACLPDFVPFPTPALIITPSPLPLYLFASLHAWKSCGRHLLDMKIKYKKLFILIYSTLITINDLNVWIFDMLKRNDWKIQQFSLMFMLVREHSLPTMQNSCMKVISLLSDLKEHEESTLFKRHRSLVFI